MGCKTSKASETKGSSGATGKGDGAAEFLRMVNVDHHPVARKLYEEWSVFVDAQVKRNVGDDAAARQLMQRKQEFWATTDSEPVTHRSVDVVGKTFLEYLKNDLSVRGWGGNFDYNVAGVAKQGFLKVSANIDTAAGGAPEESVWDVKIHYHSRGPAQ